MALIEDFVAGRTPPQLYSTYLAPLFETWAEVLVQSARPQGRVLDIACGTGIVTRKLASLPKVRSVVGIDVAPAMIATARALTGADLAIEYEEASADALPYEDGSFDAIYCQHGLQFFPDKVTALEETARVLAADGLATYAAWTSASDGNPVFEAFEQIVADELGSDLVPFGPFSFGDARELEGVAAKAGLEVVSLDKISREASLPRPKTLVFFDMLFLGRPGEDGTMEPLFDPADPSKDDQIERIFGRLEDASAPYQVDDGTMRAPSTAHVMVCRKVAA